MKFYLSELSCYINIDKQISEHGLSKRRSRFNRRQVCIRLLVE